MAPSFLSSGFRTNKTPKSPKSSTTSSGRSRFSKALPAPPPVFDKFFSSSSTSDKNNHLPPLPSLPPPSSNLLDTASFSFVPSSDSSAYPSTGHGSGQPSTGLTASAARHHLIPNISSHISPASSTTSVTSETLPLPPLPQQQPSRPIRRRPVASSASVTSTTSSSKSLRSPVASPGSPPPQAFASLSPVSFSSVTSPAELTESTRAAEPAELAGPEEPAELAELEETAKPAELATPPQIPDLPTNSTTLGDLSDLSTSASDLQSSSKQLQVPQPQASSSSSFPSSPPSSTLQELPLPPTLSPPSRQPSPGAASISSILSAYTQSSAPVDRSSASEGTTSTNSSSLLTVSSPQSAAKGGFKDSKNSKDSSKEGDEVLTPLSYLLEEEYGVGDCHRRLTDDELYEHYRQYDHNEEDHASLDATSNVSNITSPPPPPSKDDDREPQKLQALPPRTSSLDKSAPVSKTASPPDDKGKELPNVPEAHAPEVTKALPTPAGRKTPEPPAELPSVSSAESPLWKRRSEKVDGGLVLPQLTLTSTPGLTASTQQIGRKKLPAHPAPLNRPNLSPPRSPPTSPLPPPPSHSNLSGLQAPRSPFPASSPALSHLSPRVGLPSRDIRPTRQVSPALPSTPAAAEEAPTEVPVKHTHSHSRSASNVVAKMGLSLSKLEAKVEHKLKRKDAKNAAAEKDVASSLTSPTSTASASPLPPVSGKDLSSPTPSQKMPPLPPTPSHQRPPTPEYDEEECAKEQNGIANGSVTATVTSPTAGLVPASPAATTPFTSSPASLSGLGIVSPSAPFTRMENGQVSPASSPRPTPPASRSGLVGRDIRPVTSDQSKQPFPERTSSRKESISTATAPQIHFADEVDGQMTIKATPSLQSPRSVNGVQGPMAAGIPPAFPGSYMEPVASDTVFAAPPPGAPHYQCMHNHSDMFRDRNINYPLSCQTCQTFDRSMRWRCKWCYLRICSGCRDILHNEARGDLSRLMEVLSQHGNEFAHRQTDLPVIMEA